MKKLMLICAPVSSRSGYGAHSRDLVTSYLDHDKYDVKILDVPWGECPRNALNQNNKNDKRILDCILLEPQLDRQPDIYVDIRIPQEFQQIGKFNIGITAGVETSAVSQKWLEDCNKMDLVIVPSEHSREGFVKSIYDKMQNMPDESQQKIGELKLEKPIEILFEGANEEIYKSLEKDEIPLEFLNDINEKVKEDFVFLQVGQWCSGGFGEDRKDIATLIKVFYEAFANKQNQPALLLKTNGATYSIIDRESCLAKIRDVKSKFPKDWNLPNVYLLHGSFSDKEINYLYNHPKMKSFISFTHGEGFGRPLLEATMTGLPVITSAWSGHLDFLDGEQSILLPGELKQVPQSVVWENIIIPQSQWFVVDQNASYKAFNYFVENYDLAKERANALMEKNREKFKLSDMTKKLDEIMEKYLQDSPQQVEIKLPKLKKV
jgi:glycosyltransferase involved in cell wall biosynthesis